MVRSQTIARQIVLIALLCFASFAQSPQSEIKHFAKEGLAFDYPAKWTLTDKSNSQVQHLILSNPENSVLVMVIAYRDLITQQDQVTYARENVTKPFVEQIVQKLSTSGTTPERDFVCVKVGTHDINGYRLRSVFNKEATTAEIYSLVVRHRFLNLVYIRSDKDEQQGASVWETVRSTLNIEAKQAVGKSDDDPLMMQDVGILNGHAVKLPPPRYPAEAKGEHVSGTVLVEVTIDEEGNVASAHTVSGHVLLRAASKEAALKAKFTPTIICGKPVKVTGVITYNFVAR